MPTGIEINHVQPHVAYPTSQGKLDMASKFKPGDIVQLKSGGPPMTVEREQIYGEGGWQCAWFAGAKESQKVFAEAALQPYVDVSK